MLLEDKVTQLLAPALENLGYGICRVKHYPNKDNTLQIMIERLDGNPVSIKDCVKANNLISPLLDVENIIENHYNLEVSSPGVDRPLVKLADFQRFKGQKVKILLKQAQNNVRRYRGSILDVIQSSIIIKLPDEINVTIDYNNIESANLTISDSL